jgi:hypothetical protein
MSCFMFRATSPASFVTLLCLWSFRRFLSPVSWKTFRTYPDICRIWGSHSGGYEAPLATCFHAGFLIGLHFDPEDGGDMFLRNVGWLSTDYTALYPISSNPNVLGERQGRPGYFSAYVISSYWIYIAFPVNPKHFNVIVTVTWHF